MKKIFTLLSTAILISGGAFAQWCTPTASPTTMNSYASSSPVITNVTFNTINRTTTSNNKELYVNTGVGTTVAQNTTHAFAMTWTKDIPVCPEQNIRVWIDWNIDGDFTDVGELVYTLSNTILAGTGGPITIPATATPGLTRMRVAMKMVPACGHTIPDPCAPSEPVGWHGEIEDYDLTVTTATGINEINGVTNLNAYHNDEGLQLNYFLTSGANVQLDIYNVYGQKVNTFASQQQNAGEQKMTIANSALGNAGVYIAALTIDGKTITKKFVMIK